MESDHERETAAAVPTVGTEAARGQAEVEKRREIYVRQKISKLDLTRTLFFWTGAFVSDRWSGTAALSLSSGLQPFTLRARYPPLFRLSFSSFFAISELSANTRTYLPNYRLKIFFDLDNRNAR